MCIKCTWGASSCKVFEKYLFGYDCIYMYIIAYNMSFIIHTFLFDVVVKDVSTLWDANLELCN